VRTPGWLKSTACGAGWQKSTAWLAEEHRGITAAEHGRRGGLWHRAHVACVHGSRAAPANGAGTTWADTNRHTSTEDSCGAQGDYRGSSVPYCVACQKHLAGEGAVKALCARMQAHADVQQRAIDEAFVEGKPQPVHMAQHTSTPLAAQPAI